MNIIVVGAPTLNDNCGMIIMGRRSNKVFRMVTDWDFSSMYPFITIAFSISPPTLIAKLLIEESVDDLIKRFNYALEDRENQKRLLKEEAKERGEEIDDDDEDEDEAIVVDDQGKDFMDNYLTGNILNTGKRWFNLPSIEEMCEAIESHYGINKAV